MNRTLTYPITEQYASQTIEQFLRGKSYSSQCIKELKKLPVNILIDGTPKYMKHLLQAGETLTVHIQEEISSEKIPPVELPLDIIYEDEDLLVVNKPADMPIHPSLNNYENSLANALAWYFEKQNKPFVFRCINRLDRDTSGLTIVAKHMLSGGILSSMVAERTIHREYVAIVRGIILPESGTIDAPIGRKGDSIIERQIDYTCGERAITHYTLKAYKNGHSLLSIHLETGRTHQIRVHMKHIGFPLIGDHLYNPDMAYISRQALHSHRLQFTHPITGEYMDFTAPLPEDMCRVLES
ncbi:MAG: RluA family pseudouridine synthase [Lachnospiraceae bacterium]|nr:RluA family pseudouridine synthase [Lachnospiraceae bacterium]